MTPFLVWITGLGAAALAAAVPLSPPKLENLPPGPEGEMVRRGLKLVSSTPQELADHVGASLSCTNCHLNGGRTAHAIPWAGIYGQFPQYRDREGRVIRLEDRINECFARSLNGKPLDERDPRMVAIVSYIAWLSRGVAVGARVDGQGVTKLKLARAPDKKRGKKLFGERCAACHGPDGQGKNGPNRVTLYPPLWGEHSFNIGAGMARLETAAGFVLANMPPGLVGSLTPDDAYDIAAFVTQQPRPDYAAKAGDWPLGGKPPDARY